MKTAFRIMVLIGLCSIFFFPFLWILISSLKTSGELLSRPERLIPETFTLFQYIKLLNAIPFFRFFLNSIVFAGGVTILSLSLDSLAGYALAKLPVPGKNLIFFLVLVTLMIPFQIIMVPLYLTVLHIGWLDTYLGLIIPRMTNAFGIYMMRQFFLTLPNELLDAGRIDGLGEFGIFRVIALPLTTSAMATLGVFHFMYNWNDFLWPLLITTTTSMRTLPVGLALFMGEHVMDHGPIIAGAVLSILPVLIFFLAAQKTFMQGIALSGLKG